jgi:predicted Zn-dependent protease
MLQTMRALALLLLLVAMAADASGGESAKDSGDSGGRTVGDTSQPTGGVTPGDTADPSAGQTGWEPTDPRAITAWNSAVDRIAAGDRAGAERLLRKATRREPGSGLLRLALADVIFQEGRAGDAADLLATMPTPWSGRADVLTLLALASFGDQRFGSARAAADRAVELAPGDVRAQQVRTLVLLRQGEYGIALAGLDDADRSKPDAAWACLRGQVLVEQGQLAEARANRQRCSAADPALLGALDRALDRALEGTPGPGALEQAGEALGRGDFEAAAAAATAHLDEHPDNLHARFLRAEARWREGDVGAARADLRQVRRGGAWIEVGAGGTLTGVLTRRAAEQLRDDARQAAGLLALLHAADGQQDEAQQALDEARAAFGPSAGLTAVDAALAWRDGQAARAGALLSDALAAGARDRLVLRAAAWLAAEDGALADRVIAGGGPALLAEVAIERGRARDWGRCSAAFEGLWDQLPEGDAGRTSAAADGHHCAVEAGDRGAAERWAGRVGPARLPPAARHNHAVLLAEARAWSALSAWIDEARLDEGPSRPAALRWCVTAGVESGELDRALRCALLGDIDPAAAARAAGALQEAGRSGDARAVLEGACPRMTGADRTRCRAWLEQLGGR